jgi:uncharacterized protein (DUF433 family)
MILPTGMEPMTKAYITKLDTAYRISSSRVSLDSVVYAFLNGLSPESIVDSFPSLTLEQVYGAIAFYLANQTEIDSYLKQGEKEFIELSQKLRESSPLLYQKLLACKKDKAAQIIKPQAK